MVEKTLTMVLWYTSEFGRHFCWAICLTNDTKFQELLAYTVEKLRLGHFCWAICWTNNPRFDKLARQAAYSKKALFPKAMSLNFGKFGWCFFSVKSNLLRKRSAGLAIAETWAELLGRGGGRSDPLEIGGAPQKNFKNKRIRLFLVFGEHWRVFYNPVHPLQ